VLKNPILFLNSPKWEFSSPKRCAFVIKFYDNEKNKIQTGLKFTGGQSSPSCTVHPSRHDATGESVTDWATLVRTCSPAGHVTNQPTPPTTVPCRAVVHCTGPSVNTWTHWLYSLVN